jgi:uncharacterized membrane protein YphA (DoxX/SURF4 family)
MSSIDTTRRTTQIAYWGTTGLAVLAMAVGGVADLTRSPQVVAGMAHLGYPAYFVTLLGVWKVLGAAALVAPRFPRLKEWAYAGILFDLTGAAVSHAASGDPVAKVLVPLVLAALVMASWALRPASRRLPSATAAPSAAEPATAMAAAARGQVGLGAATAR